MITSRSCESLLPLRLSFAGTLVRGKQNKRRHRQGYAGKVGLVVPNLGSRYAKCLGREHNLSGAGRLTQSATSNWLVDNSLDIRLTTKYLTLKHFGAIFKSKAKN